MTAWANGPGSVNKQIRAATRRNERNQDSFQVTNLLPEGLISLCWRGSVAHGMYVPKSDPDSIDDKDVMGIYIAPIELLLNCNPNVLSLLWLKENGIIYESSLGSLLRENRDLFVTKKAPRTNRDHAPLKTLSCKGHPEIVC